MPYLHLEKVSPRLLQSILITVTQGLTYFQETTSSSSPLSVMTTLGLSPNSIQLLIVRASCELQLHSLLDDDEQDEEDPMDVNEQKKGKTFPLAVCWNSSSSSEVSPWLIPCCCQLVELCLTEVMDRSWMEIAVNLKSTLLHLLHHFITTCQLRSPPSLPVLRCMVFLIGEIDLATLTSEQNDQKKWLQTCFQHWLTEHPTETYAPFLVPCIYHLGWETESKFALILKKLDGSDIDEEWDEENEEEEDEEDEEDYII
ncbi:hypothetical protein HMI56_005026 [Coelomomyces lativittatus]|nr:hypothetical protein HMI56_005026 [Coelomomyces lativittatus]